MVRPGGMTGTAITAVVAALVTGYMIALGHQFLQGVGPELPMAAILPLVLALAALMPLLPRIPSRTALLASRSEERRVGKECVIRVDLGGRRILKKKINNKHTSKKQNNTSTIK